MKRKSCILSGDIGTTTVKAALFDANLRLIADTSYALKTWFQPEIPGSTVQNPAQWVQGFIKCVDDLYKKAPDRFSDIAVLSLTGQMEDLIAVDKEGKLVYDALLYSDSRANEEADIIIENFGMKRLFEITANEFNVFNSCAKILWLKRQMQETFSRTQCFMFGSKDYINFWLTGKNYTDYTNASTTGLYNIEHRVWESEIIDYLNIPESSLPAIDKAGRVIGEVKEELLPVLHLMRGIPVLNGMGDAASATLGAGVHQEKEAYIYGGTTGWVALLGTQRKALPIYNLHNHDGTHYINVSPILNVCNAIDWGIKTFYLKDSSERIDYNKVDDLIARKNRFTGIIFLPYLSGERSPFHDEAARGTIFGLTLNTKKEDILKAIFEGVAFSFYHNILTLQIPDKTTIPITGGISQFASFCQILAHISGIAIEKLEKEYSSPLFGTAILAGHYLNLTSTKDISCDRRVEKRYYPEESATGLYSRLFKIYKTLYPDLKKKFEKLSKLISGVFIILDSPTYT